MSTADFAFDLMGDSLGDRARLEAALLEAALRQLIAQGFADDKLVAAATALIASSQFQQVVDADLARVTQEAEQWAAPLATAAIAKARVTGQ
jgi:hypothetical protein